MRHVTLCEVNTRYSSHCKWCIQWVRFKECLEGLCKQVTKNILYEKGDKYSIWDLKAIGSFYTNSTQPLILCFNNILWDLFNSLLYTLISITSP